MNLTDTHCHLADPELRENLPDILTAARGAGVGRFIAVSYTHLTLPTSDLV